MEVLAERISISSDVMALDWQLNALSLKSDPIRVAGGLLGASNLKVLRICVCSKFSRETLVEVLGYN